MFILLPESILDFYTSTITCSESPVIITMQWSQTCANLLIVLGYIHSHAKWLGAFVTWRTRKAVESWVSVPAPLLPIDFEAQIRHQLTLQNELHTPTQTQSQMRLYMKSAISWGKIKH